MEQAVIWILGIIAFIILEAVTYQLVSIWFAIGALGGMIVAFSPFPFVTTPETAVCSATNGG